MTTFLYSLTFAGGFALCWFTKDKIIQVTAGKQALITKLETKAAQLKAIV